MKAIFALLAVLHIVSLTALHSAAAPTQEAPAAGAVVYAPHPHFRWQREGDVLPRPRNAQVLTHKGHKPPECGRSRGASKR